MPSRFIRTLSLLILLAFILILTVLNVWFAFYSTTRTEAALQDLTRTNGTSLQEEKLRQEAIALRIQNVNKTMVWTSLAANLSAALGLIVAIATLWVALHKYFDERRKERLDRSAADLADIWPQLTNQDSRVRAGAIISLQHFLSQDHKEYHSRIVPVLALLSRNEQARDVIRTLTPVVEYAFRCVDREVLLSTSWQGVQLYRPNLSGLNLIGIDFRDARFEGAWFKDSLLNDSDFTAAGLQGANFTSASLIGARLNYADLAGATFMAAHLERTDLRNIKILDTTFDRADLRESLLSIYSTNWALSKSWRTAILDPAIASRLVEKYGGPAAPPRILMLSWEVPPLVSGGAWTAVYHLVRNLRQHYSSDITIVVPWHASHISKLAFGNDVEVIAIGNRSDISQVNAYGAYSAYRSASSGEDEDLPNYQMAQLVDEFTELLLEHFEWSNARYDCIHAHDWMTFRAAERLAKAWKRPWIAHFHSIEVNRRPLMTDEIICKIEKEATQVATHLVVPSAVTRKDLAQQYQTPNERVSIVPNCVTRERSWSQLGSFNSRRVVYLGRLTDQKGPDIFLELARLLRETDPEIECLLFGRGDSERRLAVEMERISPFAEIEIQGDEHASSYYSSIKRVERVRINKHTGEIERLGRRSQSGSSLVEMVARNGYIAKPVLFEEPYTHLATIAFDNDHVVTYLIEHSALAAADTFVGRTVEVRGAIAWETRSRAFKDASMIVVPSRSEPFGMVILEAMSFGVPVLYTKDAGAAEVFSSGLPANFDDLSGVRDKVFEVLNDQNRWQAIVQAQFEDISKYVESHPEKSFIEVWRKAVELSQDAPNGNLNKG